MTVGNGGSRKQRLELTWIGKDERPRLEPRILLPVKEHSHAKGKPGDGGIHDNLLIQGDNLLALKSLEQEFAGKVRCVFIDPPYNTGAAFQHYDDGVEHSLWLSLMRDRLELLYRLLAHDGSLWVSIDDNEVHYLKVVLDELFGRENFVASIVWEKADSPRNSAVQFSTDHDHVLVYSKGPDWRPQRLPRTEESNSIYSNPDDDERGAWIPGDPYANKPYSKGQYTIEGPTGRVFGPPPGRFWRISEEKFWDLDRDGRIWWGPNKDARPSIKRYLNEVADLVPRTIWPKDQVGSNRTSKNEMRGLFPGESSFGTPKPERLLERVLRLATRPGDIVLDSFAGSGTTGAVAHKMGRRWIMVELGDHATTHIVPRLKKVIDGQDAGGITEAVGWKGGGGFRFCTLAPSLIDTDQFGQKVISKQYNAGMLAEAMCKHMGFTYAQDPALYWQQGHSSERDFIYTTTQALTHDTLKALAHDVGPDRSLLVCCKAFRARLADFPNLTVKKIPQAVLDNCEWGRDDYSLNISKLPEGTANEEPDEGPDDDSNGCEPQPGDRGRRGRAAEPEAPVLLAPARKAPLKMDGTTRQRSNALSTTRTIEPTAPTLMPTQRSVAAKSVARAPVAASKPSKAGRKLGKPSKQRTPIETKAKNKVDTGQRTGGKSAAEVKSRRSADDRQGRLL